MVRTILARSLFGYHRTMPNQPHIRPLRWFLQLMHLLPSRRGEPGDLPITTYASPASATLAGGLLFGVPAWLWSKYLQGESEEKDRWSPVLPAAILGALPGVVWGIANLRSGKSIFSSWPHHPAFPVDARDFPARPRPAGPPSPSRTPDPSMLARRARPESRMVRHASADPEILAGWETLQPYVKVAQVESLAEGPAMELDSFRRAIWLDPRIANRLPLHTQLTATAATTLADEMGNRSGWVTPAEMGRAAVGMGGGWLSGALVGKALGLLMGLPPSAQERLRDVGTYAGAIRVLMPRLFGR